MKKAKLRKEVPAPSKPTKVPKLSQQALLVLLRGEGSVLVASGRRFILQKNGKFVQVVHPVSVARLVANGSAQYKVHRTGLADLHFGVVATKGAK